MHNLYYATGWHSKNYAFTERYFIAVRHSPLNASFLNPIDSIFSLTRTQH